MNYTIKSTLAINTIFVFFCSFFLLTNPVTANASLPPAMQTEPRNTTPTEKYLEKHSLSTIRQYLGDYWSNQNPFDKLEPFFNEIIQKESEEGFFGYHGCTQQYRIFQDILRAVFEELLEYEIPEDFHFLRIPGDSAFDLKNGTQSFYAKFDRKEPAEKTKEKLISQFYIEPFNQKFKAGVAVKDLTKEEKQKMWASIMDFIEVLDTLSKEEYWTHEESAAPGSKAFGKGKTDEQQMQESALKKFKIIKQALESQETADTGLLAKGQGLTGAQMSNVFLRILKIKKLTVDNSSVNKWMKEQMAFRTMFSQAMDICYKNWDDNFHNFFFPYDDTYKPQQNLLLAMNIPLYGNFHRLDESSVKIFMNDSSIENGEGKVFSLLSNYFVEIGIDPGFVDKLRQIAYQEISGSGSNEGCLLQFFDLSSQMARHPYQGVNSSAYVSHSWGIPYKKVQPSVIATGVYPLRNKTMDFQLRLIASNNSTLNPHDFLRVVRYDTVGKEASQRIIDKMRAKLREAKINQGKLDLYKAKIEQAWYPNK